MSGRGVEAAVRADGAAVDAEAAAAEAAAAEEVRADGAAAAGAAAAVASAGAVGAGVASGGTVLEVSGLVCGYGSRAVLKDVSFSLAAGQALCLLGPNGVGKTTLFKTLLGFVKPLAGDVAIEGRDTRDWTRRDFAREVAYIPQLHTPSFSFSVHDVVLMGRTPHLSGLSSPSESDERLAQQAIERMGIGHLAQRDYASLSGGERQMVLIARALAQQPRILVMDEPCASLDFGNQARLLEQILELAAQGIAVVMTTHDPNHAFLLDGDVLCLGRGGVAASGRARSVLTADMMSALYGVPVEVSAFSDEGCLGCMPRLSRTSETSERRESDGD